MRNNRFKYPMIAFLLVFYINRGLFVAMPGIEISNSSGNEINSLLEVIINWAGGTNETDEDGDLPEQYHAAHSTQPLIAQNLMYSICLACPQFSGRNSFYLTDETIYSLHIYGTIDHPPESQLIIES